MTELNNAKWGFESNCFVCEPRNERGLGIRFSHDPELEVVTASFELGDEFSGAPSWVHGGLVLAILDEAMAWAWATIAVAHRFAATRDTAATFERPVRVARRHHVEARVVGREEELLKTAATIHDERGRCCATAAATFVALGEARAAQAVGVEITGEAATYLAP